MSSERITSIDIFADADPERPVASITRVGGGAYQMRLLGESQEVLERSRSFETIEEAIAEAKGIADIVDNDPSHPVHITALLGEISKRKDEVTAIRAEIAQATDLAQLKETSAEAVAAVAIKR